MASKKKTPEKKVGAAKKTAAKTATAAGRGGARGGPPAQPTLLDGDDGSIQPVQLHDEMERSFLDYAMSVIMSRALPDVRDGLKPVHRRIIWDMDQQGFRPDRPFVKCARVTGDTMARYHPHGDGAIYDALVRMAQPFSLRHTLIDFHGNYGSPDFGPAASRYTEARLDPLAMQLLADIDEDTVDLIPTYDGTAVEPTVLPARFPNLLVNGSQGIAVGMATSIPPHNLGEVIDATLHLLDHPKASIDELMKHVKAPDFPTGGIILGKEGVKSAYKTGKGSIKTRARVNIEENKRGQMQIVVSELPYQASCSAIAARIQELVDGGELDGIADVNDNSSGGKTNLVITLKRDANANIVMNNLFKQTQLQSSFPVNMVALVNGVPRTLTLKDALNGYVDHQIDVITRRSKFRLKKAQDRAHIIEGRIKALNVIDEIIALIRASDDAATAKTALMAQPFEFSERQAIDILDMQLRQLTRLSRIDLETEQADLLATIKELQSILKSDAKLRGVISTELKAVRDAFATPRVCEVGRDLGDIGVEDLVEDKELVIVMTSSQYVKAVSADAFRTQSRGGRGVSGTKMKTDDIVRHVIFSSAHSHLLFFSNKGRAYRLRGMDIPERDRTARGIPIVNLLPLKSGETIQAIIDTREFAVTRHLFFATRLGQVKKTKFNEFDSSRKDGLIAVRLREKDELVRVIETTGTDDIVVVSQQGFVSRFSEKGVRPMGRGAAGVKGMKLRAGDEVVSVDTVRRDGALLMITSAGYGKRTSLKEFKRKGRGGMGMSGIKLTGKKGSVVAAFMTGKEDHIVMVSSTGQTIRLRADEVSSQSRAATGVRLMTLDGEHLVTSAALIFSNDPDE